MHFFSSEGCLGCSKYLCDDCMDSVCVRVEGKETRSVGSVCKDETETH